MKRTAGVDCVSATTTCSSQTFSKSVRASRWFMGIQCYRSVGLGVAGSGNRGRIYGFQPALGIFRTIVKKSEERRLKLFCDWSTPPRANLDTIDRSNRRDFCRRAGKEQLIREIKCFSGYAALLHSHAESLCQSHDRITSDAGQNRRCSRWGHDPAVANHKQILSRTLADRPVRRQCYSLGKSALLGLRADELAREIISAGFGKRGKRIGRNSLPAGNADIDTIFQAVRTQIGTPVPGRNRYIHRMIGLRRQTNFSVAAQGNGPDVGTIEELVRDDDLLAHANQRLSLEGNRHTIDFRGIVEAHIVHVETELSWLIGQDKPLDALLRDMLETAVLDPCRMLEAMPHGEELLGMKSEVATDLFEEWNKKCEHLYEQALAFKASGVPVFFRVKLPMIGDQATNGDVFAYKAFVNPSIPAVDQDGDLMTDLKLRPTGLINWTKGA